MTTTSATLRSQRLDQVERHVGFENAHDLDAVMSTFGPNASYHDEPWDEHCLGRDAVRSYYEQLIRAVPDLHIDPHGPHVADDVIVLECTISGTHQGTWHGLPGTGRPVSIPLCGVYTFDADEQIAGERIYYDRAMVLEQLGVFHDPESVSGKVTTALLHPVTMTKVAARMLRGRSNHQGD
jgi:steroid delta-isomerase-like uncharacterized protein